MVTLIRGDYSLRNVVRSFGTRVDYFRLEADVYTSLRRYRFRTRAGFQRHACGDVPINE